VQRFGGSVHQTGCGGDTAVLQQFRRRLRRV